jgi:hypothetical protein
MSDIFKFPNQPSSFVNSNVADILAPSLGKQSNFQSFAGVDISAFIYMPLITKASLKPEYTGWGAEKTTKAKALASLQTLSISTTRSISPVRVFGRSSAVGYTRGARTIAGTMVFAAVNQDVFQDVYDQDIAESSLGSSSSLLSDQLPPFSVVITAANEKGGAAIQVLHGITLVNYGTTYSIDDLYTEVTYSYVATDLLPLISSSVSITRSMWDQALDLGRESLSSVGDLIFKSMKKAYGTAEDAVRKAQADSLGRYGLLRQMIGMD